jgi:zinc/manganese transport system substrate-binding protein
MRSWTKSIGAALVVAFMAAGLYTVYVNVTGNGENSNPSPTLTREGDTGKIQVVTSTNVWGSVVEILGGDWVEVTSIIEDPMQDPHSYEASARDQLSVNQAELVIANGGGYDDFLEQLVSASEGDRVFLKLVEGEHAHAEESANHTDETHAEEKNSEEAHDDHGNKHIWYDFEAVGHAAEDIVAAIVELRPESFEKVNKNFDFLMAELSNLEIRVEATCGKTTCVGFLATEGVGNLLLEHSGFVDQTPEELANAIEEETEVPPAALKRAKDLIKGKVISLLVVNEQVVDPVTQQLEKLANDNGLPVIRFSEMITIPEWDYLDWMAHNMDLIQEAVY